MVDHIELTGDEVRERLASLFRYGQVGHCVNSVAHDVNNILGAIMAYADLILLDPGLKGEASEWLRKIIKDVQRCSSLMGSLTAVARPERADATMIEVVKFVDHALDLRRYDLRAKQIELETSYAEGVPSLMVDAPRLQLAIIYLITNAIEALDGVAEGRVWVDVRQEDQHVVIAIRNSASPIEEELRECVFEPFCTSKNGSHLGLGLCAAREIARLHDGDLTYDPEQGFVMCLPLSNSIREQASDSHTLNLT